MRRLHSALEAAGPALDLPSLPVWDDTVSWIRAAPRLSEVDRDWLLGLHARLSARIIGMGLPWQPVHGDAHPGNALVTADGVRWTDFEETGAWPVEWDVACLMTGLPFGRDVEAIHAMLAAYGRDPRDPVLEPFLAARDPDGLVVARRDRRLPGRPDGRPPCAASGLARSHPGPLRALPGGDPGPCSRAVQSAECLQRGRIVAMARPSAQRFIKADEPPALGASGRGWVEGGKR